MKFATALDLITYAETMQQQEAYDVGPMYTNHQRAVYQIGLVQILIDTVMPHNVFKPSSEWYWTGDSMTKNQADDYANKYNARVEEAYYSNNYDNPDYQLLFDKIDDLLTWVFDNRHKELETV